MGSRRRVSQETKMRGSCDHHPTTCLLPRISHETMMNRAVLSIQWHGNRKNYIRHVSSNEIIVIAICSTLAMQERKIFHTIYSMVIIIIIFPYSLHYSFLSV